MRNDGLFLLPYTTHDWIVLTIAILGTVFRLFLVDKNKDSKQKIGFSDYVSALSITGILTIGLYEMAIYEKWKLEQLYLPFAGIIISSKILVDWLLMSEDGKVFIISTFKTFIEGIFKKFGYEKSNNDNGANTPT